MSAVHLNMWWNDVYGIQFCCPGQTTTDAYAACSKQDLHFVAIITINMSCFFAFCISFGNSSEGGNSGQLGRKMKGCCFILLVLICYLTIKNNSWGFVLFFYFGFFFCACKWSCFFLKLRSCLMEHTSKKKKKKSNLLDVQRKCPWSKAAHIHPPAASKRIHSKSTTNEYMDWNILPLIFLFFFVKCHSNEKSVGHCKYIMNEWKPHKVLKANKI